MPMEALTASSSATTWLSQSRTWLKCELALGKQPQQRTDEDLDDIVKFTRKLDFFKNMPEVSREELCRTMLLVSQGPGQIVSSSADPIDKQLWRIVIVGRLSVMTRDAGGFCPVWFFESGQTFARSYLNLFAASAVPTGSERPPLSHIERDRTHSGSERQLLSHIETLSAVKYLEVHVPERLASEFKVWTRPLWYEELAQYFHVGINEAAEALGIGPSALTRMCRRHVLQCSLSLSLIILKLTDNLYV
jgi:hypothetical protein